MVVTEIITTSTEDSYCRLFEGGRFVDVRYIDGARGELIRTQNEVLAAAHLALAFDTRTPHLVIR